MVPVASIEHQLAGRVRLRIPSKRGDVPFFNEVVRELSKHPSLHELTVTPLTGCITLHYCEPLQVMTAAAAEQKLFEIGGSEPQDEGSKEQAFGIFDQLEIALVFAGLGVYQLLRGQIFGAASSLFFYALILPHLAAMEQARGGSLASVPARTAKDVSSASDSEEETVGSAVGSLLDTAAEK